MSLKTARLVAATLGILILSVSAYAQDQDVIRVTAGAGFERHDNIFRLDTGVDPTAGYGKSARSDTILRGDLGILFDRELLSRTCCRASRSSRRRARLRGP